MLSLLQASSYAAFAIFVLVVLWRAIKYATMPIHLRWELYPVPHEPEHEHGGSFFEEQEFWKKPRKHDKLNELKEMFEEMLFIKRVYQNKRGMWYFSWPFHGGIYLILAWFALMFIKAVLILAGLSEGSILVIIADYLILLTGIVGILAATFGCLGLLALRLSNKDLRKYSSGVDYFNLVFILVVLLTGWVAWLGFDPTFDTAKAYMLSLVSFGGVDMPALSGATLVHMILLELLFVYIPFTKMSHYIGKYFTYHCVLWEDEINLRGSEVERRVKEALKLRARWSAPHFSGRTWDEEVKNPKLDVIERWKP